MFRKDKVEYGKTAYYRVSPPYKGPNNKMLCHVTMFADIWFFKGNAMKYALEGIQLPSKPSCLNSVFVYPRRNSRIPMSKPPVVQKNKEGFNLDVIGFTVIKENKNDTNIICAAKRAIKFIHDFFTSKSFEPVYQQSIETVVDNRMPLTLKDKSKSDHYACMKSIQMNMEFNVPLEKYLMPPSVNHVQEESHRYICDLCAGIIGV